VKREYDFSKAEQGKFYSAKVFDKELNMPYVNIRLIGPLKKEQKEGLVADITKALETHAGKPADSVLIEISEGVREDWAKAGVLYANR
jgi:4-oxalocrotonate tautomerase